MFCLGIGAESKRVFWANGLSVEQSLARSHTHATSVALQAGLARGLACGFPGFLHHEKDCSGLRAWREVLDRAAAPRSQCTVVSVENRPLAWARAPLTANRAGL